jgi:U3 small nucleolar RNA-associated protein 7
MERTYKFTQQAIAEHLDEATLRKMFSLDLQFGPYAVNYSRNGKSLLLGGKMGHLTILDWQSARLRCEVQVKERVRDVCFLHNDTMFAAAQRRSVYIYDQTGMEIHRLPSHADPQHLSYLPYHFLLVSLVRFSLCLSRFLVGVLIRGLCRGVLAISSTTTHRAGS